MALKFEVDTVEGLDEPIAALYSKDEASGKFFLEVDGAVHKRKLDEFRENNVKLLKEKDELLATRVEKSEVQKLQEQYESEKSLLATELEQLKAAKDEIIDAPPTKDNAEELKQLNKKIKQLEAVEKAKDNDNAAYRDTTSKTIAELQEQVKAKSIAYNQMVLSSAVNEAAASAGVDPSALPAIKAMASIVFKTENDSLAAYDETGSPLFSKDGTTSLSVKEWATNLKASMPQLFIQPIGAGTQKGVVSGISNSDAMTPLQRIQKGLGGKI